MHLRHHTGDLGGDGIRIKGSDRSDCILINADAPGMGRHRGYRHSATHHAPAAARRGRGAPLLVGNDPVKREAEQEQNDHPHPPEAALPNWGGRIAGWLTRRRNMRNRRLLVHFSLDFLQRFRGFVGGGARGNQKPACRNCDLKINPPARALGRDPRSRRAGQTLSIFATKLHVIKYFLYDGAGNRIVAEFSREHTRMRRGMPIVAQTLSILIGRGAWQRDVGLGGFAGQ